MDKFFHRLGTAINWSALSSIGNSKIARLTILMPIIGYLLIFNSTILGYLEVSLSDGDMPVSNDWLTYLYSKNMKFLYFGLLVFGLGVALYNIVVPIQIKKYPSVEDYISAMEKIKTKNLVISSFDGIIAMHQRSVIPKRQVSDVFVNERIDFPGTVRADLHRLIEEMFLEINPEDWGESESGEQEGSRFWTGSGYLMTDDIIEFMYSGRRVDRPLMHMMYETVDSKSKDVFYIEHKALEYSGTVSRFITFMLYGCGLVLTAIPTILTSLIIIKGW